MRVTEVVTRLRTFRQRIEFAIVDSFICKWLLISPFHCPRAVEAPYQFASKRLTSKTGSLQLLELATRAERVVPRFLMGLYELESHPHILYLLA